VARGSDPDDTYDSFAPHVIPGLREKVRMLEDGDRLPRHGVVFPLGGIRLWKEKRLEGAAVFGQYLDPRKWAKVLGTSYLNHRLQAMPLRDVRVPKGKTSIFMKPLLAQKAFNGTILNRAALTKMKRAASTRVLITHHPAIPGHRAEPWTYRERVSAWHPYPHNMVMVAPVCPGVSGRGDRYWWVNGKLIRRDGGYKTPDFGPVAFREKEKQIAVIFEKLFKAGGQPIMIADFLFYRGRWRMVEMNCPNSAAFYEGKPLREMLYYLSRNGKTVSQTLKERHDRRV
jgi:hypothetical protein